MSVVKLSGRQARQRLAEQKHAAAEELVKFVKAALQNEQVTRSRVDAIEQWKTGLTNRSLWGRLRWLVTGG